jgi:thiol-disulfide isomerase/thioredoxin
MTRKTLLILFVAILAAAIGIYAGMQRVTPQTPQDKAVAHLFAQSLPDLNGQPQPLAKWRGKPLLINFWASWCGPCVEEMPELVALHHAMPDLQIIGIGVDSAANLAQFADKLKVDYPLYVGGNGAISIMRELGNAVGGLPFTLLIGPDGTIRKTYIGALDFTTLRKDLAANIPTGKSS